MVYPVQPTITDTQLFLVSDIEANWCVWSETYCIQLPWSILVLQFVKHQDWFDQNNIEIEAFLDEKH